MELEGDWDSHSLAHVSIKEFRKEVKRQAPHSDAWWNWYTITRPQGRATQSEMKEALRYLPSLLEVAAIELLYFKLCDFGAEMSDIYSPGTSSFFHLGDDLFHVQTTPKGSVLSSVSSDGEISDIIGNYPYAEGVLEYFRSTQIPKTKSANKK